MLIGLMSDTHDCVPQIDKAMDEFNARNIQALIHAGDFNAPFSVARIMERSSVPFYGVFGNIDGEKSGLIERSNNF